MRRDQTRRLVCVVGLTNPVARAEEPSDDPKQIFKDELVEKLASRMESQDEDGKRVLFAEDTLRRP